jgi:hypothetical protein
VRLQAFPTPPVDTPYTTNLSWLDLPSNRLQSGTPASYDLSLDNINDVDDVTDVVIGSTGQPLCIDSIALYVDDDGAFNFGGDGGSGFGSRDPTLYTQTFTPPACTSGADPLGDGSVVHVGFNALRSSTAWQHQHTYWNNVVAAMADQHGVHPPSHFSGMPDTNYLKAFIYGAMQNTVHDAGYHFTRPIDVAAKSSMGCTTASGGTCGGPDVCPGGCSDFVGVDTTYGGVPQGDVLHVGFRVKQTGGSFAADGSFDLQLVTHCGSDPSDFTISAIPKNLHLGAASWLGTTLNWLTGSAPGANIGAIPITSAMNLNPTVANGAGSIYQMSFTPYNPATGVDAPSSSPAFGLRQRAGWCNLDP